MSDTEYLTITSRNLAPADCDHSRRTKFDSHRCLDCRAEVIPCDVTYYGDECDKTGAHVWHSVKYPNGTGVEWEGESLPRADYACVICGEPEGSDYARPCCDDNVEMV